MGLDLIMNLLEFFRISNTISFKEGDILLMNQNVNVIPTSILCDFQKELIDSLGFEQAYDSLYDVAKKISFEYNSKFIKTHRFKSSRDTLEWQIKIVTLAGWGEWSIKFFETEKPSVVLQINNSPFPTVYGKANFPVDIIATGLVAGGAQSNFGEGTETIETKCTAKGDSFCELKIGPKKEIEALRSELWSEWKLI